MDPFTGKRNYRFTWTGSNMKRLAFTRNYDAPMYRRDMYFALDAEMVGVGPGGMESALARVSLVNWENEIVFHAYVQPEQPVTDYRTHVSGIKPEHIRSKTALPLAQVRKIISSILLGKVLIGHGLENDLKTIGIDHPWCDTRDTATYEPLMCKQQITSEYHDETEVLRPRKLKDLVLEKLGREIQVIGKAHCPIEDAIASMDLYKLCRHDWEKAIRNNFNSTNQESFLHARKRNDMGHRHKNNMKATVEHIINSEPFITQQYYDAYSDHYLLERREPSPGPTRSPSYRQKSTQCAFVASPPLHRSYNRLSPSYSNDTYYSSTSTQNSPPPVTEAHSFQHYHEMPSLYFP